MWTKWILSHKVYRHEVIVYITWQKWSHLLTNTQIHTGILIQHKQISITFWNHLPSNAHSMRKQCTLLYTPMKYHNTQPNSFILPNHVFEQSLFLWSHWIWVNCSWPKWSNQIDLNCTEFNLPRKSVQFNGRWHCLLEVYLLMFRSWKRVYFKCCLPISKTIPIQRMIIKNISKQTSNWKSIQNTKYFRHLIRAHKIRNSSLFKYITNTHTQIEKTRNTHHNENNCCQRYTIC